MKLLFLIVVLGVGLSACGDRESDSSHPHPHPHPDEKEPGQGVGHGTAFSLGHITIDGKSLDVYRLGDLVAGKEGAFEVKAPSMSLDDLAKLNVYLWVESQGGTQLSAPSKGALEGEGLHFHVTPKEGDETPFRVVVRLRGDDVDERASLPLDGHGHEHPEGAHHGVPSNFSGEGGTGYLELKLHDDKGDLELWLTRDPAQKDPFDLPLSATIEIEFVDVDNRKVTLSPRDQERNEDEGGNPNVRDGKTNYFIYPGASGEDSAWLTGKDFQSIVIVRFTKDEKACVSEEFVLTPHSH